MISTLLCRLISNPDSLCVQILRAKYYPDGNILKYGPKKGTSFTCQSIIAGINVFKRGFIWRVGNGELINIWDDPWIQVA
jgi:hypothetical protein